jgi:sulfatase maturation enzyme AslB (radical SAM superfamily)
MNSIEELKNFRKDIPGIFNEAYIIKSQLDRLKVALYSDIIVPPYEILIHPSGICNLKCQWCIGGNVPTKYKTANNNLKCLPTKLTDPSKMEKLIKNIISYKKKVEIKKNGKNTTKEFRVERVQFSGIVGEPLIAKESIKKAIQLLTSKGIKVGIFTNATLIDKELIDELLKISYINISLDAGTPSSYAKMKYGGARDGEKMFYKVIDNIKNLVKARNDSEFSQLKINASYVLYPDNYKDIYTAAKLLKKAGIDTLRMKQDNSGKNLLSEDEIKEANMLLKKVCKLKNDKFDFVKIHILNNPSEMERAHERCIITDLMAAIGSDGNFYPCNYHPRVGGLNYGNAIKENFKSIWEGEKRRKIKKLFPAACPAVCDPFKNRANRLLNEIINYQRKAGQAKKEEFLDNLANLI